MSETNELDITVDYSSENEGGQVGSIESFLDESDLVNIEDGEDGSNIDPDKALTEALTNVSKSSSSLDELLSEEDGEGEGDENEDGKAPNKGEDAAADLNIGEDDSSEEDNKGTKKDVNKDEKQDGGINYKSVISKFVKEGLWEEIEAFETEEGEQIPFDEMDIDEETFIEIFKQKNEDKTAKALENKVSVDGISDFTQKLIEIEKNGGNVQQALESYQRVKNPLESLDLEKESDQQAALYMKYQTKGLEDSEIIRIIKGFKAEGVLEEEATQAKSQLEAAFEKQMEAINKEAIDRKELQQKAIKDYRKTLGEELSSFQLKDTYKKKLLDLATKENKDGRFELDSIYSEIRKDPKKSAELVLFLTDREEYLKQVTEEERRQNTLGTMRTIKLVNKSKSSPVKIKSDEKSNSKNYMDISEVID